MDPVESEPEVDLDNVFAAVQSAIDRERGPQAWMRSLATPARNAIAAGAVVAGGVFAIGLTHNWSQLQETVTGPRLLVLAAYLLLLGLVIRRALRPMQRIDTPLVSRSLSVMGVLIPFFATAIPLHESHEIVGESGYCVVLGSILAALFVVLFRVLDRGGHSNPRSAFLSVAAAAMASNLALEYHCPITRVEHKLAFHASVGLALALGYGVVFARQLARARKPPRTAHQPV